VKTENLQVGIIAQARCYSKFIFMGRGSKPRPDPAAEAASFSALTVWLKPYPDTPSHTLTFDHALLPHTQSSVKTALFAYECWRQGFV
jgi:hypothetical protein